MSEFIETDDRRAFLKKRSKAIVFSLALRF